MRAVSHCVLALQVTAPSPGGVSTLSSCKTMTTTPSRSPLELKTRHLPSSMARGRLQRRCALLVSIPVHVWT